MEFDEKRFSNDWWKKMSVPVNFYSKSKTQKDKAEEVGVSQSKISRLESGRKSFSSLTVNELIKFCEAMGTNPKEYFIEDNDED